MTDESDQNLNLLQRFTEKAGKIKLAQGLVGKMTQIAILTSASLATIACLTKSVYIEASCVVLIGTIVLYVVYSTLKFARENPATALLEGAEFIQYQKEVQASKYSLSGGNPDDIHSIPDPTAPEPTLPLTLTPDVPENTSENVPTHGKGHSNG